MPERWQDELKKLRREEMPGGVRERAEAGSRRELPNDGRQRLVAGLVAFVVFIAAGAFAWHAFGGASTTGTEPTPSPAVASIVLDLDSHGGHPKAMLSSGGVAQSGVEEGYEWCASDGQCTSGIFDFQTYPPVSDYLVVPGGMPVKVMGDGHIDDIETILPNGDRAPADVRSTVEAPAAPSRPGRYVWNVSAGWDEGSANFYFGIEVLPPPDQVPDVLHVSCTPFSATVDSGVVRAQPDGVHIAVDASDGVTGADVVQGSSPQDLVGVGVDANDDGSRGLPIAPSSWSIGCYSGSGGLGLSDIGSERVAVFRVLDPDHLYRASTLDCDVTTASTLDATASSAPADQDWASIMADSAAVIPGLRSTDVVRNAGYPDAQPFKDGAHPVVIRGDAVIGTIRYEEFQSDGSAWSFTLESCQDSGLGDGNAGIEATAAPVAEVAMVRCTDGAAEVETPTVRPLSDGVHIVVEAPGAGEELGVVFQSVTERNMYLSGGQDPRNGLVRELGSGMWRVACYDGPQEPDHVADDAPTIEVVDPEGLWIPTTLGCTGGHAGVTLSQEFWTTAEDAIRAVEGVRPTDVVELAGYPEGASAGLVWRVVRDGSVVAWLHVRHVGNEWYVIAGMGCADAGIGMPSTIPTPGT
jgi:hypothetical protein